MEKRKKLLGGCKYMKLYENGVYLSNGTDLVEATGDYQAKIQNMAGKSVNQEDAAKETIAYGILESHNT
jgi:aconitate hydratase